VRRYIKYNNIILLVVGFKFFGVMAIIVVKDKQLIFALYIKCYMEIKIPNLIYAFLISSLPVINYYNAPGGQKVALLIPIGKVVLPS